MSGPFCSCNKRTVIGPQYQEWAVDGLPPECTRAQRSIGDGVLREAIGLRNGTGIIIVWLSWWAADRSELSRTESRRPQ